MDRDAFAAWTESIGLELGESRLEAFDRFLFDLYQANERANLTRIPKEDAWLRHFADSLLDQDLFPVGASVLDIGAGPGFPAWPLACARPDLQVTALDSSGKMLGFLQTQPLENLQVVLARAEEWGVREAFEFVTGRALAPLPIQLELSAAPCRIGGTVIPMRAASNDVGSAPAALFGLRLEQIVTRTLPETGIQRAFPVFRKTAPTPQKYPRRWAEIRNSPLQI